MELEELLAVVVLACEKLEIRYFVTGSIATIAYGEPRFTNDIDVVVDLPLAKSQSLCNSFSSEQYYVSEVAVQSAIRRKSQFNLIHPESGLKVDFMVAPESEFNQSRLDRTRKLPILDGKTVWFASPEDTILMKLKYFQEGQSDKHVRDIRSVLKIQGEKIDNSYIRTWAAKLAVAKEWELVSGESAN